MKLERARASRVGNAGVIASFAIAFAGVMAGAFSAYFSERGSGAVAARDASPASQAFADPVQAERDRVVERLLAAAGLERLQAPSAYGGVSENRPKIVVIIDDMGLDPRMAERIIALPGPLTLSFLPYAREVETLAEQARSAGAETMLHLPMEPLGHEDPGPNALRLGMTGADFVKTLEWNLSRFDGYAGVNNHMGSRLTADKAAMKTILAHLKGEGLFFLDSITTAQTAVREAGAAVGAEIFERDVFLDAEIGNVEAVKAQLELVERIALETGYAVAIGHPHETTIEALGPWLTSAPARGFEIVTVSALIDIYNRKKQEKLVAEAPALRL